MPIYAYRCDECGFTKDALQKISDPVLTVCPSCGKDAFKKQVTAAGFQLKGSGWYVTDFRGGNAPATGTAAASTANGGEASSAPAPAAAPAAAAAPAPVPAAAPDKNK
ncbi:zinc ribbon domain-containing protein [Massilia sp. H6]|uniref:FmdB family zinc ribbon protein n=1 Tax=Massilia sp. H6 TaxID=2970464 RepID=UPI0021691FB6|nr:zinc ribbon domain-containing protein [Massilia sp. H6]UVW29180.1 zinc ribbon domain-containing protein [Massilia sp. H6]